MKIGNNVFSAITCFALAASMLSSAAQASSDKYTRMLNSDNNYFCLDSERYRFKRATTIGKISLSVRDFDYNSGDAEFLNAAVTQTNLMKQKSNQNIMSKYVKSVQENFSGLNISLNIAEQASDKFLDCLKNNNGNDQFTICQAEQESFVASKFGNEIVSIFCNLRIKGRKFPILVYSKCSIDASSEMSWNFGQEIDDIHALEPSSIEAGVTRILDNHIRELSKIIPLANRCE